MTAEFPVDAPRANVIAALESLGFRLVRQGNHIAMIRDNADATHTPLTLPAHSTIKRSTLRTIFTQASITSEEFVTAYRRFK